MNQRADFVIPECYIDTNLVETLVCSSGCNHQKGCNQVAKVMQEKFTDRFALGIIDADKRRPSYLNEFSEIGSSEHLTLMYHPRRRHYIILVTPAADTFILACAEAANVSVADYGLSPVLKEFTAQTKNVMSNKDPRFKRLFQSIKDASELQLLKSIISYLVTNTYQSVNADLQAMFNG